MSNCQIVGNVAQGGTDGSSTVGGEGLGGGLFAGSGTVVLEAVLVSGNQAQGGVDSQGKHHRPRLRRRRLCRSQCQRHADMQTLIAGNQASKSNNDVWGTITIGP